MQQTLPDHDIVLLGAGHTNAHIIRMWRMHRLPNTRLSCVSNFPIATYSGMLPGALAGLYSKTDMEIDLVRLCAAAGVRLIQAEVSSLDLPNKTLHFAQRSPIRFDALSVGVGSQPVTAVDRAGISLPIKPMQTFLARLDEQLSLLHQKAAGRIWRIVIAGSGAGGVEVAFCLPMYIHQRFGDQPVELTLIDRAPSILRGMPPRTIQLAQEELKRRNVTLKLETTVGEIAPDGRLLLETESPSEADLQADLLLWATSARPLPIIDRLGLPTDSRGFLLTRDTLQSVASDAVFAVGDAGTCQSARLPKAGVYAVRQGPILWDNLRRYLAGRTLRRWQPQKTFMTLLNTGDRRAILTYKGRSVHARWCWWLKDSIDSSFMKKYQDYQPPKMAPPKPKPLKDSDMLCGGCGCKLPPGVLSEVLRSLKQPQAGQVQIGLEDFDDVALVALSPGRSVAATVDFFTSFLDDPYLVGRIAALNALSDLFASGVRPVAAIAMVTVPQGPPVQQREMVRLLLEGGVQEFGSVSVPIVGGHTVVGAEATVGFTLLGEAEEHSVLRKSGLRLGDRLVLTKPLGTGVLLAGHMRARCRAEWMEPLLEGLLRSNATASQVAQELGLTAVTDVTGFGLAGHLLEMLKASGVSAEIDSQNIPFLPGARELATQGLQSSLAPGNRSAFLPAISNVDLHQPEHRLLFDPQTSGGLLLGVPENCLEELLGRLTGQGQPAAIIGEVTANQTDSRIDLRVSSSATSFAPQRS